MARWRPRYPPAVVRPPLACPTGLDRYASRDLAWYPVGLHTCLTPRQCTACDGGWHLIRPTEGDTR